MNHRIKKKIDKRSGYFHYKDYKNQLNKNSSTWGWSGNGYGECWNQGSLASDDYNALGLPRRIYASSFSSWYVGAVPLI